MSNPLATLSTLTPEQLALIKSTVAKNASDDELALFLYRCRAIGLDPLKNQIYFVKYGNNPGTIVTSIDGFRAKAAATGMHTGTKRGVIRDDKGVCIGAWCEVYRANWTQPAREEVSLHEYNTGKAMWARLPETMIKKVAEVAALRMAFPDELGGTYSQDEMDQADVTPPQEKTIKQIVDTGPGPITPKVLAPMQKGPPISPGDHVVKIGKSYVGRAIKDIPRKDLEGFVKWIHSSSAPNFREGPAAQEFLFYAETYLQESGMSESPNWDDDLDSALAQRMEDPNS